MTSNFKMMIYASLFAALTAAGAYIAIPIGPVPIVLQNLFVLLAGLALGGKWGAVSIGIYLIAGAVGLPVFAIGTGGIGRFAGPTGGYLIGFFFAAYITGIISSIKKNTFFDIIAMIIGSAVIYIFGITWLKMVTKMS
ncbi:MAG: biotin transporter BioY, partial [Deltaproteobacteria bacterium]|nr:biotin transporter BioY [Deltaproteobacteria bacterium]